MLSGLTALISSIRLERFPFGASVGVREETIGNVPVLNASVGMTTGDPPIGSPA